MHQPYQTIKGKTQPPPRVIPPRISPRFSAASYPKMKKAAFPRVEDTSNNNIKTRQAPAHNTRSRTRFLSLTQYEMLECVEIAQLKITPTNIDRRKFPIEMLNAVLYEETGELMEMRNLVNIPKYHKVWIKLYGNELVQLAQRITGQL